jgi:hypothetical protein
MIPVPSVSPAHPSRSISASLSHRLLSAVLPYLGVPAAPNGTAELDRAVDIQPLSNPPASSSTFDLEPNVISSDRQYRSHRSFDISALLSVPGHWRRTPQEEFRILSETLAAQPRPSQDQMKSLASSLNRSYYYIMSWFAAQRQRYK